MIEQLQPRGGTEKVFRIKAVMIWACYSPMNWKRKLEPPSSHPLQCMAAYLRMDRTGPSPQLKDAARYGRIPRGQVDLNRR